MRSKRQKRIIEVILEYPEPCALTEKELNKIMEVYRLILDAFICDDYKVLIRTYEVN